MDKKEPSLYTADELEAVDATVDEQEVTLCIARGETEWKVWVTDNLMLYRFKTLMKKAPQDYRLTNISWTREGNPAAYEFTIPKKCVLFRAAPAKKDYSEEEIEEWKEKMKKARESSNNPSDPLTSQEL